MATVTTTTYASDEAIVATNWDSLVADDWATLPEVTNVTNKYVDVLLGGQVNFDTATGALAAGESFDIYICAKFDTDTATSGTGGIDALFNPNDSSLTLDTEFTNLNIPLLTSVRIRTGTPDVELGYNWGPIAIAQVFGGIVPQKYFLLGHNNTGGTMKATTSTNIINLVGITYTHT